MSIALGLFDSVYQNITIDVSPSLVGNKGVNASIGQPWPDFGGAKPKTPPPTLDDIPKVDIEQPEPPPGISVNPQFAAYKAVRAMLDAPLAIHPVAPVYGEAVTLRDRPEPTLPTPDLDYPQSAFMLLEKSAGLDLPSKPTITIGERPDFVDVVAPEFVALEIEPFEDDLPDMPELGIAPTIEAQRVAYDEDAGLRSLLRDMLAGKGGLDYCQQTALAVGATDSAARGYLDEHHKVMRDTAARGFGLPTGQANAMLLESKRKLIDARQDAVNKTVGRAMDAALDALSQAVSQAIALERRHVALHMIYCGQLVEALRFNVRAHTSLFDLVVEVHNAKVRTLSAAQSAYKNYVDAVVTQDKAALGKVRVLRAVALSNRAKVDVFESQAKTLQAISEVEDLSIEHALLPIDEYEAYLVGVRANLALSKQNVESYREALRAFSASVGMGSEQFQSYADQINAGESVFGVHESNIRAQSEYWRVGGVNAQAWSSYVQGNSEIIGQQVRNFVSASSAQRGYVATLATQVTSEAQMTKSYVRSLRGNADVIRAHNNAVLGLDSAINTLATVTAETATQQQALDAMAELEKDRIEAAMLAADSDIAAALAQSAMTVHRVNAQFSAKASVSDGAQETISHSEGFGGTRSYSWSKTTEAET